MQGVLIINAESSEGVKGYNRHYLGKERKRGGKKTKKGKGFNIKKYLNFDML